PCLQGVGRLRRRRYTHEMHHRPMTCRAVIGTILVVCLLGMTAAQPNAVPVEFERPAVTATAPCGALAGTVPHVRSVVLVMMENHATPVLGSRCRTCTPPLHAAPAPPATTPSHTPACPTTSRSPAATSPAGS